MKDKYVRKTIVTTLILCAALMIGLLILLPAYILSTKMEWQGPDQGLWYCEKLQMQLCFQYNRDIRSNALIEGIPVVCDINTYAGTYRLCVINQDESGKIDGVGSKIFEGEMVSLDEESYIVQNRIGESFTFGRVEEFSLQEKRDSYKNQIDTYSGVKTVEETKHLAVAIQKAKALWKSELGLDAIEGEVVAAVDLTDNCWLITITGQNAPMALINPYGEVIGVWR